MNKTIVAVYLMTLKTMSNDILAAANLAITGFGTIAPENKSREIMEKAELVRDNGHPHDTESLSSALSIAINARIDAGTW